MSKDQHSNSGEDLQAKLGEFEDMIDSIAEMVRRQERFVDERYRSTFLRLLDLLKDVGYYDVTLARKLLKYIIEASIILLTEKNDEVDIRIVQE